MCSFTSSYTTEYVGLLLCQNNGSQLRRSIPCLSLRPLPQFALSTQSEWIGYPPEHAVLDTRGESFENTRVLNTTWIDENLLRTPFNIVNKVSNQHRFPQFEHGNNVSDYIDLSADFSQVYLSSPFDPLSSSPTTFHSSTVESLASSSPRTKQKSKHSREAWDQIRPLFEELYASNTLHEVAVILRDKHGFDATENMYKKRISDWGIKKNMASAEKLALLQSPNQLSRADRVKQLKAKRLARSLRQSSSPKDLPQAAASLSDEPLPESPETQEVLDQDRWWEEHFASPQGEFDRMGTWTDYLERVSDF